MLPPLQSGYWDVVYNDEELEDEEQRLLTSSPLEKSKCEQLYGPYHNPSWPIPKINERVSRIVPPSTTSIWDIGTDYRDLNTNDDWIPRHGELPRLNGMKSGFRAESIIENFDFLVNRSLHFVQNRDAVPRVTWGSLKLRLTAPKIEKSLSMDEVLLLRPRKEFPVTLVSAFLRQTEMNAIRSIPCQVASTCCGTTSIGTQVYKGVLLRVVLKSIGVERPFNNRWVIARGADGYSASIPLYHCCNPSSDVLLAYVANGEPLLPDHGYPLRIIVPGWVASYSVKWLNELIVTHQPDMSPPHLLLPPQFTALEMNSLQSWQQYRVTEASLQCIITVPAHNHQIALPRDLNSMLQLGGFAFAGGGRRINRVEISIDEGHSWIPVKEIFAKEESTCHDMNWCWVWWTHEILVEHLVSSSTLRCRAWDSSNNTQPDIPTWNRMGVGANHVYALRFVRSRSDDQYCWLLQHPIAATGGWMKAPVNLPRAAGFGPLLCEDKFHTTEASPLVDQDLSINDDLERHKQDCATAEVKVEARDESGGSKLSHGDDNFKITDHRRKSSGIVRPRGPRPIRFLPVKTGTMKTALSKNGRVKVHLKQKTILTGDSILLNFALPQSNQSLGLPTGQHVLITIRILEMGSSRLLTRPYTPVSSDEDKGCVLFVLKVLRPTSTYPEGGKMSQHLEQMHIGDPIEIRGPVGGFEYIRQGAYSIRENNAFAQQINMVAGGLGIAPMMQLAAHIIRHPEDVTQMTLLYACRYEGDLLLRSVLDQWAELFPTRFRVRYILSDGWPADWTHSTGYVDAAVLKHYLFPPNDEVLTLVCGPPIFVSRGCLYGLSVLGYSSDRIYCF